MAAACNSLGILLEKRCPPLRGCLRQRADRSVGGSRNVSTCDGIAETMEVDSAGGEEAVDGT